MIRLYFGTMVATLLLSTAVNAVADPVTPSPLKGRIFLSGIVSIRPKGEEKDEFLRMLLAVDPATGKWTKICDREGVWPRVSPDGQTVVCTNQAMTELWNCDTQGGNNPRRIAELGGRPLWSSDGKHLIVTKEKFTEAAGWEFETWRLLIAGGYTIANKLPLPKSHAVRDWSPDGKWLLTASNSNRRNMPSRLSVMRLDGTGEYPLPRESPKGWESMEGRFSSASNRLAYVLEKGDDVNIWVADLDGSNPGKVFEHARIKVAGVCWSPDGQRLAMALYDVAPTNGKTALPVSSLRFRLVVMDADGKNPRDVRLPDTTAILLACPDWRAEKE